jgi:hypothetical protein
MSLPLAASAFNAGVQLAVREQLALAARLTKADAGKVFLTDITAADGRRAGSQGVSFVAELSLSDAASAAAAAAGLSAGNINTFLAAAGLPAARVTAPPAVHSPPAVAAVTVEATPAPPFTVGGLPLTTIIAIASSVGGAVGLTAFACCLQRLHRCGCLPKPVQRCLPTSWYDPERKQEEDDKRTARRVAQELQQIQPTGTAPQPGRGGAATAPEPVADLCIAEKLPTSVSGRPPPFVPNVGGAGMPPAGQYHSAPPEYRYYPGSM